MTITNSTANKSSYWVANQDVGQARQKTDANGNIYLDAGSGKDEIAVSKGSDGLYHVAVNGVDHAYTADEMAKLRIRGGRGADSIKVDASVDVPVRVAGGRGNDAIANSANGAKVYGGRGNDAIANTADGAKIRGGRGNDLITSEGNGNRLRGGRGNDAIASRGDGNVIRGRRGNDAIWSEGDGNRIRGGRGNDAIVSRGDGNDIRGRRGNDLIDSEGWNNFVRGGRGRDLVRNAPPASATCASGSAWSDAGYVATDSYAPSTSGSYVQTPNADRQAWDQWVDADWASKAYAFRGSK